MDSIMEGATAWNWNALLHAKNIFPEQFNNIKTTTTTTTTEASGPTAEAVVSELQELLENGEILQHIYESYKKLFEKDTDASRQTGCSTEKIHRDIFKKSLLDTAKHNMDARQGKHSWWQGVNQFTDMTPEESRLFTGFVPPPVDNSGGLSFILGPIPAIQEIDDGDE